MAFVIKDMWGTKHRTTGENIGLTLKSMYAVRMYMYVYVCVCVCVWGGGVPLSEWCEEQAHECTALSIHRIHGNNVYGLCRLSSVESVMAYGSIKVFT